MNVLAVAFYSPEYEPEARLLAASHAEHRRVGGSISLTSFEPFDSWNHAVAHKPRFLRSVFDEHPEYDAYLYVDADARFMRTPDFAGLDGVGFAYHEWKRSPHHEIEVLTGTLWLLNTPTVRDFVEDWADATPPFTHMDCPEQQSLRVVLPRWQSIMTTKVLGPEWCWIEPDFREHYIDHAPPIIVQTQASRRLRGKVGKRKVKP